MQSSPPTRAMDHLPSPAKSQYSFDLSALDLASRSGASTPLPTRHVDKVLSEDIDGPSDFTLNMEKWMRGGTLNKKHTIKSGLPSLEEGLEGRKDAQARHAQVIGSLGQYLGPQEEHVIKSPHTPNSSPPGPPVFHDHDADGDEHSLSSDWDPYEEGSTPQPPAHQHFLQPTVEDYNSELNLARIPSQKTTRSVERKDEITESEHQSPGRDDALSAGRPSSPTLSPVRSPETNRKPRTRQFSSQTDEALFEQQLQELREKCRQLEHLNKALGQAVDNERRMRLQDAAAPEVQSKEAARREKDLTEMKTQAYLHKEDFRVEFSELKRRVERHEEQQAASRREMEQLREEHATQLKNARKQVELEGSKHQQAVRALEQELILARRGRDEAEDMARNAREDLEEYRDGHDAELESLRLQVEEVEDLKARTEDLAGNLSKAQQEKERAEAAQRHAEEATNDLRTELAKMNASAERSMQLATDHRRAVALSEDLQTKVREIQQQFRDEQAAHESEMERLKSQPATSTASHVEDIESLRTQLNEAILERDAMQDSLSSLQSKHQALQSSYADVQSQHAVIRTETRIMTDRLEDLEAVNSAFDTRISGAIRKREAYWRMRVTKLEDERALMKKVLMRMWGREEVGIDVGGEDGEGKQAYLYKYLQREWNADAKGGA